jgi:hypothetical protein
VRREVEGDVEERCVVGGRTDGCDGRLGLVGGGLGHDRGRWRGDGGAAGGGGGGCAAGSSAGASRPREERGGLSRISLTSRDVGKS